MLERIEPATFGSKITCIVFSYFTEKCKKMLSGAQQMCEGGEGRSGGGGWWRVMWQLTAGNMFKGWAGEGGRWLPIESSSSSFR